MGKKAKNKGRNPRKVTPRAPASSPMAAAAAAKPADPKPEVAAPGLAEPAAAAGACKHYRKDDAQVNRLLLRINSSSRTNGKCEDCREEPGIRKAGNAKEKNARKTGGPAVSEAKLGSGTMWVCLDCNHIACGGGVSETEPYGHARRHAKHGRHSLAVRFDNPLVGWCFTCNSSVPIEMPDAQNREPNQLADIEDVWFGENGESGRRTIPNGGEPLAMDHRRGYTVRGLTNLGNTCFFNSVMQNLLAMDRLRDYFLSLDQPVGPLTMALRKLFVETGGGNETDYKSKITPSNLFGCVCSKAPQFRGYQQQDSHELLQYLLDGLITEELSFRKLDANSHKSKMNNECDEDRAVSDSVMSFVDVIFGGQLCSTVCCTECGHSSMVYEPFLDLSLPVPKKKAPPKHVLATLPKKSKLPPKEASRGRGWKIRERRGIRGTPTSEKLESVSSPSESNIPFCDPRSAPEQATTSTSLDVFWWVDYIEPAQVLDNMNQDSQSCSTSVTHGPENERENLESSSELQGDSQPRKLIGPLEYPGGDFCEDKVLPQIQDSEVILLPYRELDSSQPREPIGPLKYPGGDFCEDKVLPQFQDSEVILLPYRELDSTTEEMTGSTMESQHHADMNLGDTAACESNDKNLSSSVCGQAETDFDGFGDLFNEPETAPDSKMETSICEDLGTSWLGGNSSESNQDEVDDTMAPVSVDHCLACFTTPEILSDEHAWHCENCSKLLQPQNDENKRGKWRPVAQDNGSMALMCQLKRGKSLDQSSLSGFDSRVSDAALLRTVDDGLMTAQVNHQPDCGKVDKDEYRAESEHTSQCFSCGSTPGEPTSQASSGSLENDLCSRDELTDAANGTRGFEAGPSSSPNCREMIPIGACEKSNLNNAVQVTGPNLTGTSQAVDDSGEEKTGSQYRKIKRDATKRILINKAPCILTIHLKRFSQDARGRLSKLNGHVSFPEALDLRPYMDTRCGERDKFSYCLLGVVEHSGSMRGGHYVAYVRGKKGFEKTQEDSYSWFYASDAHVHKVSLSEVLQSEAYILFYERV